MLSKSNECFVWSILDTPFHLKNFQTIAKIFYILPVMHKFPIDSCKFIHGSIGKYGGEALGNFEVVNASTLI